MCEQTLDVRFQVESPLPIAVNSGLDRIGGEMVIERQSLASDRLVTVVHEAGHYLGGRLRNVVAFYWISPGTLRAVEAVNKICEEVSSARTRPFSAIHIVRANVGLPDAPVRQALSAAMKRFSDVTCCIAVVTPGAGFWVSALQSAITGMRMLAPGSSILRFVPKPEDLRGWFIDEHMARTGESLDDARVIEAVNELLALGDKDVE